MTDVLDRLAEGLDKMNKRMDELESKLESCNGSQCDLIETQKKELSAQIASITADIGNMKTQVDAIKIPEPAKMPDPKDYLASTREEMMKEVKAELNEVKKCVGDECTNLRAAFYSRLPEVTTQVKDSASASATTNPPAGTPPAATGATANAAPAAPATSPSQRPPQQDAGRATAPPPDYLGRGARNANSDGPRGPLRSDPNFDERRRRSLIVEQARARAEALARARAMRERMTQRGRQPQEEENSEEKPKREDGAVETFECPNPECGEPIEPFTDKCQNCGEELSWLKEKDDEFVDESQQQQGQ